jgi:hypothetical protein
MTFQPVLPLSGASGWTFLKRTMDRQRAAHEASPVQMRDEAYFRGRIGSVQTAEQLVSDKRLLRVSLAAFGLEGDVNSRAFIQKILEGGTLTADSLANKLADKQYLKLSAAFGFGDFSVPRTRLSTFADEILTQFRARSFESAVGAQNNDFRLALNAERELPALASRSISETAKWYTLLGNAPLRELLQTALGLPKGFSAIDLDQQVAVMREKVQAAFGAQTVTQFSDPAQLEALVRRFHVRAEIQGQPSASPAAIALALLRR